jgi:hypothetical protein
MRLHGALQTPGLAYGHCHNVEDMLGIIFALWLIQRFSNMRWILILVMTIRVHGSWLCSTCALTKNSFHTVSRSSKNVRTSAFCTWCSVLVASAPKATLYTPVACRNIHRDHCFISQPIHAWLLGSD